MHYFIIQDLHFIFRFLINIDWLLSSLNFFLQFIDFSSRILSLASFITFLISSTCFIESCSFISLFNFLIIDEYRLIHSMLVFFIYFISFALAIIGSATLAAAPHSWDRHARCYRLPSTPSSDGWLVNSKDCLCNFPRLILITFLHSDSPFVHIFPFHFLISPFWFCFWWSISTSFVQLFSSCSRLLFALLVQRDSLRLVISSWEYR